MTNKSKAKGSEKEEQNKKTEGQQVERKK